MDFSYKNVYGTEKYNEFIDSQRYLLDDKFLDRAENYELSDGFSVEVSSYEEIEEKERYFSILNYAQKCTLKNANKIIYEYDCFNADDVIWIVHHSNGHRYYLFKVDLYGISCLDVDTLEVYNYIPEGYSHNEEYPYGESFIVTDVHYDKESNLIAYGGCYWAAPSEVMVGDFSNPLNFNPHLIGLHNIFALDYDERNSINFKEWKDGRLYVWCNKTEKSVSVEELKDMINKLTDKGEK